MKRRDLSSCEGGKCLGECSPGCTWSDVNNTNCQTQCFTKSCDYDGIDCPQCSPGCKLAMMGDGVCQDLCNVKACNYDQGDCPSSGSTWEIGVLMAFGVTLIVLSFLCMSVFIFIYCKSRRRVLPEIYIAANSEDTVPSLTEAIINSKYPEKYYEEDEKYSQTTCSICLEDFTADVLIRQLNCEHIFHKTCITEWFLEHSRDPRCPLCKLNPF
ncbi:unnamed protein product [Blepharisma stoltei]|uniref:RING-type domain-containing protein n=1 Tax=Blepharisma stoltei TaxID=1481888 RepID=A0AAU9J4H6_9CILI|nr:unnamed protein product [Blepharisma stoltei]